MQGQVSWLRLWKELRHRFSAVLTDFSATNKHLSHNSRHLWARPMHFYARTPPSGLLIDRLNLLGRIPDPWTVDFCPSSERPSDHETPWPDSWPAHCRRCLTWRRLRPPPAAVPLPRRSWRLTTLLHHDCFMHKSWVIQAQNVLRAKKVMLSRMLADFPAGATLPVKSTHLSFFQLVWTLQPILIIEELRIKASWTYWLES